VNDRPPGLWRDAISRTLCLQKLGDDFYLPVECGTVRTNAVKC
jgi:hypothetical protein